MSTIPSVDLGMAALSGIASANISIAVPVLSQNLCYVAIPDSRTGAACVWRSAVGALTPTFPTRSLFCFLIVEGFLHTHDIKKYLRNMLVFAIIAEPIYDFVQTGQLFDLRQQNVMCELLLSLVFLIILEKIQSLSKWKRHIAEIALIVLTALAAEYTKLDGGVYGILLVAAFYLFHDSKAKMFFAAVCAVLLSSCHIVGGGFEFATANVFNPDVAAAVVSLLLINLYNGKRGLKLKYFFYVFYPAHLALLYGVSLIVLNCL